MPNTGHNHASGNACPEIPKSIKDAGIFDMQINLTGNRMFMIMEVDDSFDPAKRAEMDANNPKSAGMGTVNVEVPTKVYLGPRKLKNRFN